MNRCLHDGQDHGRIIVHQGGFTVRDVILHPGLGVNFRFLRLADTVTRTELFETEDSPIWAEKSWWLVALRLRIHGNTYGSKPWINVPRVFSVSVSFWIVDVFHLCRT